MHGENDVADFLFALISHLESEPEIAGALHANVFDLAPRFKVSEQFQCDICQHVWLSHRGGPEKCERHVVLPVALCEGRSLSDALQETTKPKQVEHVCTNAHCRRRSPNMVSNIQYRSTPDILLLQLARSKGKRMRLPVSVAAQLTTPAFGDVAYTLRAAAIHSGKSVMHGHYTSLVSRDDRWYLCDDNSVQAVRVEHALAEQSFKEDVVLLAYERVGK
jgi:uncharacterized UBP type Zn finger protein